MILKFWGTHGGYPTDQQMTCLQFTSGNANILLDIGSVEVFKHPEMLCEINAVLLTHLHMDHAAFLPQFILSRLRNQGTAFRQDGCPIYTPEAITQIMEYGGFPDDWIPWSSEMPDRIGDLQVSAIYTRHARICRAYKLIVDGKTVVISGDTSYFEGLVDFARGADWFICECNDSDDRREHAQLFGHMTPATVAQVIRLAKPERTILYHLDMLSPQACEQAIHEHLGDDVDLQAAWDGLELKI